MIDERENARLPLSSLSCWSRTDRTRRAGDRATFDRTFELLYPELRQMAHRRLARGARDGLIETAALVNGCYVKFIQRKALMPTDRSHFLAYSATGMRSIIVDCSARCADGPPRQVTLDSELGGTLPAAYDKILDAHAALEELAHIDERLGRVVEIRYFGGMENAEIAEALGLPTRTVRRGCDKAWLPLVQARRT